ncbi:MAG: phosphoenolpyruvate--protein phosphotransferase [Methylobacterium sp.]|uniref:phosphoenolpyruvate--protein phosphotransferase n=1 Tax=unclassified Methylobacterium TaxID=2615210 RepID=UPI0006F969D5|nr:MULTISPECIES: phosphoenolpyruvate--protein phosphotransferase [unclassified Methylobacterium]KQP09765.1 peptidase [Methylobacterium sp. Leaf99]MDO9428077.1 phosphoenolpyruvate--protein phosphotransferase [Methylobacterium sp.]TXM77627.1 phosphoenolpyruvate--protein phosphotransferase [Methylobacterium sp. WL69]
MPAAPGGPRLLLRRLREAMAEPVSPQARLDRIVTLIAANVIAEVCSVYVLSDDSTLELFATEGLNREAVHLTRMRSDEGLVGLIAKTAEPLSLSDAQSHPSFSYRPETGEEAYHAFLGVPLLRAGNTLGVLVVQNKTYRVYSEEEIEALQTTAMVLAEMIASGELQALAPGTGPVARRAVSQRGVALADGIGLGHVVLHEPRIVVKQLIAENVDREVERLELAIGEVRSAIDDLVERGDSIGTGESREVLETVRMFAHDKGWLRRMREAVQSGLTAEAAVERVQSDNRARMMRQSDPYLRDRLHDLDDLANRLLRTLIGHEGNGDRVLPENAILVARSMGPAALLDYDRTALRGVVLEEGGPTSHIAIVARALGIPAVGEITNATALCDAGDAIIVDGATGEIQVRPGPEIEAAYGEMVRVRAKRQEQYRALRDLPAVTRDGVAIGLQLNAGLLIDLTHLAETGADGIGLFRTELQFMVAQRMPSAAEQQTLYEAVFAATGDLPVTVRTLDIGGDKILPYMPALEEENPALGWRAIRIGLDRPALLRVQLRALLRAAAGRPLKIMFPMVATVDEFTRAKAIVEREKAHLRRHGHPLPSDCRLGVMVEVPSLLFQIDEIARAADFLSVGSNDLMQFLFAVDRENRRVANRFDTLSVPALRAFRLIAERAAAAGCPATVCGEIGGKPLEAMALIGLGFRHLSMSPAAIGPVKAMVLGLDASAIAALIDAEMARAGDGETLRPALTAFAKAHGVPI